MEKRITCIMCPLGCRLVVKKLGESLCVSGNTCIRGDKYGKQEYNSPMRMVTSLVYSDRINVVVPVKTTSVIPKDKIKDCLECLKNVIVRLPINAGQVVISNVIGLGVDIIATRSIK